VKRAQGEDEKNKNPKGVAGLLTKAPSRVLMTDGEKEAHEGLRQNSGWRGAIAYKKSLQNPGVKTPNQDVLMKGY